MKRPVTIVVLLLVAAALFASSSAGERKQAYRRAESVASKGWHFISQTPPARYVASFFVDKEDEQATAEAETEEGSRGYRSFTPSGRPVEEFVQEEGVMRVRVSD
ncbi:MAG: hypothetical protein KDD44_02215 [Bdellovibrionales bacterium]|nr:hypothetical protein [Bdellovibrionales bacterium]